MEERDGARIEIEPLSEEEDATDRVTARRRWFVAYAVISGLGGPAVIAFMAWKQQSQLPPTTVVFLVATFAILGIAMPGFSWWRAVREGGNFRSRKRVIWEFSETGADASWHLEGFGPCEGWRTIWVECKKLPARPDKRFAAPMLRILIDNSRAVVKAGEATEGGDNPSISVVDKVGEPVRILITHARPDEAAPNWPWTVEVGVHGDPNPPQKLVATRVHDR